MRSRPRDLPGHESGAADRARGGRSRGHAAERKRVFRGDGTGRRRRESRRWRDAGRRSSTVLRLAMCVGACTGSQRGRRDSFCPESGHVRPAPRAPQARAAAVGEHDRSSRRAEAWSGFRPGDEAEVGESGSAPVRSARRGCCACAIECMQFRTRGRAHVSGPGAGQGRCRGPVRRQWCSGGSWAKPNLGF